MLLLPPRLSSDWPFQRARGPSMTPARRPHRPAALHACITAFRRSQTRPNPRPTRRRPPSSQSGPAPGARESPGSRGRSPLLQGGFRPPESWPLPPPRPIRALCSTCARRRPDSGCGGSKPSWRAGRSKKWPPPRARIPRAARLRRERRRPARAGGWGEAKGACHGRFAVGKGVSACGALI